MKRNRVITITGSADLTMEIPCARCLTPVATPFQLEFDLQIDLNLSEEEREEKEEDSSFVEGDELDVEELVRNELIVNGRFECCVKMTVKESAAVVVRI